ncbi:MAG: hypothetical protein IJQ07_00010 [Clostridia bacterium]|nr:hypothetical protein [Clostridia bacterium]
MVIFLQEITMQLFLWMLRLIDGTMEIFSAIAGITDVTYQGQRVNIIEHIAAQSSVGTIFWCVFILAVGLTAIFTIVAIVKNMITNNRNLSSIVGKFFLALLGTMAMLAVVVLGILISNSVLVLVARIFQIENSTKLSNALFNACVGDGWINGYSIAEVDVSNLTVREIMGDYNTAFLGIWPVDWQNNAMIAPDKFLYFPSLVAAVGVMLALLIAVLNLARRVYEIIFLYIVMPASMSTLPLDDGMKFKTWRETFITKIILAYGAVFSVNIFILLLPIITKMHIDGISGFGNNMFLIFMIIGGAMMIPAGQQMFARLFGSADDMHAGGGFLRSAFYGGRIASALTIGAATKMIRGVSHIAHHHGKGKGSNKKSDNNGSDGSEKYSENKNESTEQPEGEK